ncbi:unnamed protein product, partial [Ectocarpus sp. 4 AP-2014]
HIFPGRRPTLVNRCVRRRRIYSSNSLLLGVHLSNARGGVSLLPAIPRDIDPLRVARRPAAGTVCCYSLLPIAGRPIEGPRRKSNSGTNVVVASAIDAQKHHHHKPSYEKQRHRQRRSDVGNQQQHHQQQDSRYSCLQTTSWYDVLPPRAQATVRGLQLRRWPTAVSRSPGGRQHGRLLSPGGAVPDSGGGDVLRAVDSHHGSERSCRGPWSSLERPMAVVPRVNARLLCPLGDGEGPGDNAVYAGLPRSVQWPRRRRGSNGHSEWSIACSHELFFFFRLG